MVPDHGGWLISTAASLHRSRPRFHLVLLAVLAYMDRHTPTPHHQSSITNNNNSTPSNPPRVHTVPTRDRPGGVLRAYEATPPVSTKFSVSNDAAKRSKRPACSARQSKRVQELAAARAAHYDGICLALGGGALALRARGRFCMLPEPPGDSPGLSLQYGS